VAIYMRRSGWTPVDSRDWGKLIFAGFIANVLYQVLFIFGLRLTTAGNSSILLATSPLSPIAFHAWFHRERIARLTIAGMVLSLGGIGLIIAGSGQKLELGGSALLGDGITLSAAMLWGLNANLQKPLLARYSVLQLTSVMMVVGAVGLS